MAKSLIQLNIILSGTTEVDSEKSAFRRVAEELNKQLGKTHAITLKVWSWPDDVRPGVNTDPQAELNRQIGEEYDIYIGLLGTSFGTPTPRAGSGTEEEFARALAKFKANSRTVRLLFYFKRSAEDPYSIDMEGFLKVKKFRDGLTSKGVLYSEFKDTTNFVNQIKDHLYNLIIEEWVDGQWIPIDSTEQAHVEDLEKLVKERIDTNSQTSVESETPSLNAKTESCTENPIGEAAIAEETDLGFLDYVEGFQQSVTAFSETMTSLTKHTATINERVVARTSESQVLNQEIERLKHIGGSRDSQAYLSKVKKVADDSAADLEEYVLAMSADLERYRTYSHAMLTNFREILEFKADFCDAKAKSENKEHLMGLIDVMMESQSQVNGFQEAVRRVPALTGKYKRARNRAASMLGEFVAEISFSIDEAKSILKQFDVEVKNDVNP